MDAKNTFVVKDDDIAKDILKHLKYESIETVRIERYLIHKTDIYRRIGTHASK